MALRAGIFVNWFAFNLHTSMNDFPSRPIPHLLQHYCLGILDLIFLLYRVIINVAQCGYTLCQRKDQFQLLIFLAGGDALVIPRSFSFLRTQPGSFLAKKASYNKN